MTALQGRRSVPRLPMSARGLPLVERPGRIRAAAVGGPRWHEGRLLIAGFARSRAVVRPLPCGDRTVRSACRSGRCASGRLVVSGGCSTA